MGVLMKNVIITENKPIKLWLDDIEEGALEQAKNLANLPFIFKHIAIMPDSQRGKGNKESFMSCSHGAGRKMGRKQAQLELDIDEQKKILDEAGVIHGMRNAKDLDEAPGAYNDIVTVMGNQQDLVDIVVELKPLAVIKG